MKRLLAVLFAAALALPVAADTPQSAIPCSGTAESQTACSASPGALCGCTPATTTPAAPSSLLTGLIGAWQLQDLTDEVNGYTLTNNNGVLFVAPAGTPPANMPVTVAEFEKDSTQWLSRAAGIVTSTFSVSLWINPESAPTDMNLVSMDDAGSRGVAWNSIISAGQLQLDFWRVGSGTEHFHTAATVTLNTWHHYVLIEDPANNQMVVYVDGVSETFVTNGSATGVTGAAFILGKWFAGVTYDGQMSGVYFASRVWTPTEVACLYNGGAGGFYPFTGLCN